MQVYVVGDSISVFYGPFLEKALQGIATYARKGGPDATGTDWENPADANGGDSQLVRSFLADNLDSIGADWLLVNCGLHDLRVDRTSGEYQVSPEDYRDNLAAIVKLIQGRGINPVWLSTTPLIDDVHNRHALPYRRFRRDVVAYNQIAAEVMRAAAVATIDLFAFTQRFEPDIYVDHVHHTLAMRQRQANFIADELRTRFSPP
jgi:lysophospholipase L1-like esterase